MWVEKSEKTSLQKKMTFLP